MTRTASVERRELIAIADVDQTAAQWDFVWAGDGINGNKIAKKVSSCLIWLIG